MSDDNTDTEATTVYEEVRRLEGHIEHVTKEIADLGVEEGDTVSDLREKGLSATQIRAAKRYTKVMHSIANKVAEYRDSDDNDDDDDGSSFKVDGTLR